MVCKHCGYQISGHANFCPICGRELQQKKSGMRFGKYAVIAGMTVVFLLVGFGLVKLFPKGTEKTVPGRQAAAETEQQAPRTEAWKDNVLMRDRAMETIPLGGYKSSVGTNPVFGSEHLIRYDICRVIFEDTLKNVPKDHWDVSEAQNNSVLAWTVPGDGELYELHIAAEGGINGKVACEDLFCGYGNVTEIQFNGAFHTEETENFNRMFYGCWQLEELDLRGIRTDSAVSLSEMFANCLYLTSVDVSSFDTSEAEDISGMFSNCRELESVDITGFDLFAVRDVSYMFYECPAGDGVELILDGFWFRNVDRYGNFMDEGVLVDGEPWIYLFEPELRSEELESPSVSAGDIVIFGRYEQDNDSLDGKEYIEWQVLDVNSYGALLMSCYALDSQPYHTATGNVTWENCSLRSWLNETFLETAFTKEEQEAIQLMYVDNSKYQGNQDWNTDGGNDTADRIFLLSYEEAERYFMDQESRVCMPTAYAAANGADTRLLSDGFTQAGWWWLRSPGENGYSAAFVNYDGGRYSNMVSNGYLSVRPVMWVRFDSWLIS